MQRYPAYKDSGLEWLSEIPAHWKTRRIKYLFREIDECSQEGDEPLLSVSQYTGVTVRGIENSSRKAESLSGYRICYPGDFVSNIMLAWLGAFGVSNHHGIVSPAYCVYRLKQNQNPQFFDYLFHTPQYLAEFARNSTGVIQSRWRLYTDDFFRIFTLLPPREEQDAIVAFLEEQTAVIDKFITNKRRLIELLEEQKQVVVNTAVTQGLDPTAPRKPSGIDWLDDIPAHWETKRLKFLTTFVTSGSRGWAKYYSDEGALFIRVGNLSAQKGIYINLSDRQNVSPPLGSEGARTQIQKNDVLVAITGATIGSVGVICDDLGDAYVNQHVALTRPIVNKVDPRWLGYCIHSEMVQKQIDQLTTGGTKEGLGLDDVRNFVILLPDLDEQREIIDKVEANTAEINAVTERTQREIELIEEYWTTLIATAVTGKIDVRPHTPIMHGRE